MTEETKRLEKKIDDLGPLIAERVGLIVRAANTELELRMSEKMGAKITSLKDVQVKHALRILKNEKDLEATRAMCVRNHRGKDSTNPPAPSRAPPIVFKLAIPGITVAGVLAWILSSL